MGIEDGILFSVCAGILIGVKMYANRFVRKHSKKQKHRRRIFENHPFLQDLWYGSPIVITKTKGGETSTWTIGNGRG